MLGLQDGGGKLRRHQAAQEQADIDQQVKPTRNPARSRCRGRMARTWTVEQREAQRRRCLETNPWTRSTGPTSEEGKLISSMNNLRHGLYCKRNKIVRLLATWLLQAQQLEEYKADLATWLPVGWLFHNKAETTQTCHLSF